MTAGQVKMMMNKKWLRRTAAALCASAMLLTACAEEAPALLEPAGVTLATAEAYIGDIWKVTAYDGAVTPRVESAGFSMDGEIDQVCVVVGQQVKQGDVLMTLNQEWQTERRAELEDEIAALEIEMGYDAALAQIDLRILELELEQLGSRLPRDEQAIALKKLDIEEFELSIELQTELSRLEMKRMRSELAQLEADASQSVLTAPCDGTVMFLADVRRGDYVSAYSQLVYIADDSSLTIESTYISESYLKNAGEMYALVGSERVEIKAVPVDQAEYVSLTLAGEAVPSRFEILSENADISAGQYAAVCLVSGLREDVLLIPSNALYVGGGKRYVYVVEDGQRIHREVKTGQTNGLETQILEGLEEGERVYVQD